MTAYDYDKQEWVTGEAGTVLRKKQMTEELALLQSQRGEEYFNFAKKKGDTRTIRDAIIFLQDAIRSF